MRVLVKTEPRSTLWSTFPLPLVTLLQYTQVKLRKSYKFISFFSFTRRFLHEIVYKKIKRFLLLFSVIAKKALRHSGHQSQLCHTDWLWWWQIQTAASVKLVCSDSEVSILICFMPLNLQTNVAALVLIYSCVSRNRTGGKRTSLSWKQRVFMLLLVGVLGFFTLIIIMAKLGRASAGSDPNLDPLLNPNIRVGKNWKHALVLSLSHTTRLCSLGTTWLAQLRTLFLNPMEKRHCSPNCAFVGFIQFRQAAGTDYHFTKSQLLVMTQTKM